MIVVPLSYGDCPGGGFGPVACEDFLVGGICVCVLLDGTASLWKAMQCPVGSFGVYIVLCGFDSLSFNVQGWCLLCWKISMQSLALDLANSWLELGLSGIWRV